MDVGNGPSSDSSSAVDPLTGLTASARAGWAAENRASAQRLSACYDLLLECQRRDDSGTGSDSPPGHAVVDPFVVATGYVVAAMAVSALRAESMISFAADLHQRYPAVLAALAAGRLDQRAAELLARQMATVDPEVLPQVQQDVVDDYLAATEAGERLGRHAVRDAVDAIITRYDAEGIRRRKEDASRARGVRINKGADGMSTVSAILATEEAAVLAEAIDQRAAEHAAAEAEAAAASAAAAEATGESGSDPDYHYSKAERRADALLALVCGDSLHAGGQGRPTAPLRPKITVIAPGNAGGGNAGAGNAGAGNAGAGGNGAWDDDGVRVEFTRTGEAALQALLDMLVTSDGASFEKVDPRIGAADDARRALRYRPGAELARRIRLRDGTCRHPGCAVPADDCDIDHVRPFDHADPARGGPTEECNLMCLCRRHHRFKTFSDWIYDLAPDGTLTVITPDGATMTTRPSGPLGVYRREHARNESRAWDRQQQRNPDPTITGGETRPEPTYWTRRAARLSAERARATGPVDTRPGGQSRWWKRNAPVFSTVEHEVEALLDDIIDPPPF
ncbi:HNH endonuclease signature motif containing protein [Dietzia cercidiphylli]|uniref:HNH endonuclease signature motif containing protein n=1 Tax=Dietzia cercidiphylli TaxID=498199 RepID=UPI00223AE11D|nr:HNH endonuclease signature motif containing protein [Dietzia cercidiphylli]MCT1516592.1 HNH endonuclease [Dietzia cercidiphylli]